MNIDVINILNNVFNKCSVITDTYLTNNIDYQIKDVLEYDIINFIKLISKENVEERIFDFCKKYFQSKKIKSCKIKSPICSISIPLFLEHDVKNNDNSCDLVKNMFIIIGKYFMFSKYDKKDIDKDRFSSYIIEINEFLSKRKKSNYTVVENELNKSYDLEKQVDDMKQTDEYSLQELLEDFNSLIGLEKVKIEVRKRINQIQVDHRRKQAGFKTSPISLHLVFTGNPGTGKTTVARKLAEIYKKLGVLSQGQLIEVDRSGLVGSYVGSTALKTQEVIDKAIGGILFIDEAYTLAKEGNDFGQEAIDTLLKAMEDKRDDLVVIVAGYTKEMNTFLKSNPGLESRFNKYIEFDDYTAEELLEIFKLICKNDDKYIHDECNDYLKKYFNQMITTKTVNFANGRTVRNYYEKVIENLNERLIINLEQQSDEELQIIRISDLNI